ncbi:LacI family transcriptional regulator [Rathayibacter sp. AY1B7]|uniref:LacI family DNA-binding transcriptional regulator n=1 Tax=unclassified Rathayibacter TaxID=2609250 RepID=UPI000CE80BF6|nr:MULTISPECIES: LacI family DNA-binding transcriptional regulator [unclassified Rathayibacter]PPF45081.1 LacI family transcriptional regulator [Rathayibacter sp. AY1A1]PPG38926.1 LacI family transcriptional regulator [Rathayibacter sp. AY2B5]PPG85996.1 LacI family transcriptional regulator [Rathayibacter sp. AY1H2]PPG98939.1 LacI family transcriptional regulator [Rathayibacter sp. AY1G9]PPH04757.1 LacI family transcriptional regulator [Rathayibacter sp. AY1H3]
MAVTLHDVARAADVSIKTVSNVINDYPHVRPATRSRVQAAIAQLGYRPNLSARSLRRGRTGVIGLALPELSLPYFAELADSVMRAADERGLTVLIEQTGGDPERERSVLASERRQLTDGLLFSPLGLADEDALAVGFPLVLLGERIFTGLVDHVTMQNTAAAHAATAHLLASGRRRIVALGTHPDAAVSSASLRLEGYRAALAEAGIAYDERMIGVSGPWRRSGGAEAMRRVLASGLDFDAVFALNDTLALGAVRALQEAGVRVPEEVAVIGFDDIDEAGYSSPSLSSVDSGRDEIARTAVEVLQARIEGTRTGPGTLHEAAFTVVARESTAGRPIAEDPPVGRASAGA